nr:N-acetylmuramoyl-L-alanine amidase [Aestuariivita boseongensis]
MWHPSPNFGPRRDGLTPQFVVLHYTAMEGAEAALERLCDPEAEVSAHYLIGRDGTCWQMVEEDQRAWHAGVGSWMGVEDINSRSIGIELDNRGSEPFGEPLMAALEGLLRGILARWDLPAEAVIGHSDMAPGRKCDPGPRFDWARLVRQGLAASAPDGDAVSDVEEALRAAGYTADASPEARLTAFRMRFAQASAGPVTEAERRILGGLAARSSATILRG